MISNEPKQIVYDKSRTVALVLYILVESLDRAERTCMSAIIDTQSYCVKLDWQWSRHICLKDMSGLDIANNFFIWFFSWDWQHLILPGTESQEYKTLAI